MRCPPGLTFDDSYQRCEWPSAMGGGRQHRLGRLRDQTFIQEQMRSRNVTKKVKQMRLMTTTKRATSTVSSGYRRN